MRFGLNQTVLAHEKGAEARVRLGVTRFHLQRLAILRFRVFEKAFLGKRRRESGVCDR